MTTHTKQILWTLFTLAICILGIYLINDPRLFAGIFLLHFAHNLEKH